MGGGGGGEETETETKRERERESSRKHFKFHNVDNHPKLRMHGTIQSHQT